MKTTKYSTEITTQKAEKYLKERKTRDHLLACLLAWYQRRNFPRELTEKYFVIYD